MLFCSSVNYQALDNGKVSLLCSGQFVIEMPWFRAIAIAPPLTWGCEGEILWFSWFWALMTWTGCWWLYNGSMVMALDNLGYLIFLVCQTRPGLIVVTWTWNRQMPHQGTLNKMQMPQRKGPLLSIASIDCIDTESMILDHWTIGGVCKHWESRSPVCDLGQGHRCLATVAAAGWPLLASLQLD